MSSFHLLILFFFLFSSNSVWAACLPDAKPLNPGKVPIRIAIGNWLSTQLNGHMVKLIIEEGFGHPCELYENGATDHVVAMNEYGVDIAFEMWSTHQSYIMEQLQDPIFASVTESGFEGREGWYIPDYLLDFNSDFQGWRGLLPPDNLRVLRSDYSGNLTEEKNIYERLLAQALEIINAPNTTSSEDLTEMNHVMLKMAESLQQGNSSTVNATEFGELWTPDLAEEWDTSDAYLVNQLGLPLTLKYIPSPVEENLIAMVVDWYRQRKPFLTYLYSPLHIFDPRFGVNLVRIQLLDWTEECGDGLPRAQCVYPIDHLKIGTSINLAKKSIIVSQFMQKFKHKSTQDVNKMMADVKFDNMTLEEAACRYVVENRAYIESFFPPPQMEVFIAWNAGAGIALTVVALALILSSVGIAIYLNIHRKNPVVMASSLHFCNAIILGSIIGYSAILTFIGEPTNVNCVFRPILLSCSFGLMYCFLLMKNFRIWRIFSKPFASSNKLLSDKNLLIAGASVFTMEILILVIWFAVDFPNPAFSETVTEIILTCQSNNPQFGTNMVWGLFSFNCLLVLLGLFLAVETRKVNSKFRESKFLGLAIYNMVILGVVFLPFIAVENLTTSMNKQVILCVLILLVPASIVVILFVPKILYIAKPELAPSYDSSNEQRGSSFQGKALSKQLPQPKLHGGSKSEYKDNKTEMADTIVDDVHSQEANVLDQRLSAMKTGDYDMGC